MAKKDLWGDIGEVPKNPKKLLKEQADVIGQKTKYVLTGKVVGSSETKSGKPIFTSILYIVAKRIDNYSYNLLLIEYPLEMYPVKMFSFPNNKWYKCATEEEFIKNLGEILSSEEVRKTITALVSQSTT